MCEAPFGPFRQKAPDLFSAARTRNRALPCKSHLRSGAEQKTRASMNGMRPF